MKMVEGRAYKTKLCVLYKRGHCPRHNCSFAHGNAELRHYNGKPDYLADDLREKLDKRYSPRRHTRGKRSYDDASPTRSLEKSSSRKSRKRHHFDGQSEFSGSFRNSDGADDRGRERSNSEKKIIFEKQLKEVHADIKMLDHRKSQLRVLMDENVKDELSLNARIEDLNMMLSDEAEECRRITSKIKKFVKAHRTHLRVEDELKRSQVRLQKLGDQLISGSTPIVGNEENLFLNEGEKSIYHSSRFTKENQSESQKYFGSSKQRRAKIVPHSDKVLLPSTSTAANADPEVSAKDDVDVVDAKNDATTADLSSHQTKNSFSQNEEKKDAEELEDMVDVDIV